MAKHQSSALPGVVARTLSGKVKRAVWARLRATDHAAARALSFDPFLLRLQAEMGASPVFSAELVREAKRAHG